MIRFHKILSFFAFAFFFVSIFVLSSKPVSAIGAQTYPRKIRVVEVRFFPAGTNYVHNPDVLSSQLQTMLRDSSKFHGYSNPTAIPSQDIEVVQVINHQFKRPSGGGDWEESYKQILANDNLCQTIKDQNIDQLWVWADPRTGYDESPGQEYAISSNNFKNTTDVAVIPSVPFCNGDRGFVFFEFDFSRSADNAFHSFGHYMESLTANLQSGNLFWNQYSGDNGSAYPRSERCGSVHFPPNGRNDYDYSNSSYVRTSCEDWNPTVTGVKTRMNCSRWGCTQEGYLKWWFQNMPNNGNPLTYQGKKLPNWFDFNIDLDGTLAAYKADGTYYLNQAFLDLNKPAGPRPAHIGTTTTSKQNTGTSLTFAHTVSGNSPLLLVTASYRAATNPSAQILALTYGAQTMTFIRRDQHADRTTEIWSLENPMAGTADVTTTFSANPEDQVIAATTINDVVAVNPIGANAGAGSDLQDGTHVGVESVTVPSSQTEVVLGVLSTYPDGGSNIATTKNETAELWNVRTGSNNIASQGATEPGASSVTLEFGSPKNWSWAMSAVSVRIVPTPAVKMTLTSNKTAYTTGVDTSATFTAVVTDETGAPITSLTAEAFETLLDTAPSSLSFTETGTPGTYTSSLDLTTLQNGTHQVSVKTTDTRTLNTTEFVSFTLADPVQNPTTSIVNSITYRLEGGKNNNKNIVITVNIKNNLNSPVSGASVGINLKKNGSTVFTGTGTTSLTGDVSYTYLNAPAACYATTVTSVTAAGLTWNGTTPTNQVCK